MPLLPPQNNQPLQVGSGFTNLQRYLQANKTNQLGQTVSAGVQQAGTAARGAINQAGQTFQQGAEAEKQRLGQQGQKVDQTLANPTSATDADVSNFDAIRNAQSLGPTGVANADELRSKAQEAQSLGQATGSQAGRFGLLQRYIGRGNQYNAGQQRLDQMLLGQTGQQQLRSARGSTIGVGNEAERQIGAANEQGKELQGQARQLADSTISKLGQNVSDYDTAMTNKLAQEKAGTQSILDQFGANQTNAPIQMDQATIDQLKAASNGVLDVGKNLYNADLSPYLQTNSLYATNQGAQSADDLAKIQALSRLSGNSLAGQTQGDTLQKYLADPSMVGKYLANQFSVTSDADLNGAINTAGANYQNQLDPLQVQLTNTRNSGMGGTGLGATLNQQQLSDLVANFANDPNFNNGQGMYGIHSLDEARAAQKANLDKQADLNNQMTALGPQFNFLRQLKANTPAASANPIEAGTLEG